MSEAEDLQAKHDALASEMNNLRRAANQCYSARLALDRRDYNHLPAREASERKRADFAEAERLTGEARKHEAMHASLAAEHREVSNKLREAKRVAALADENARYAEALKAVTAAEKVRDDLETKRELQRGTLDGLIQARQPLAFEAKTGSAKAQKELDRLAEEQRQFEIALSDLEHAISVARQKVADAKTDAAEIEHDIAFEKGRHVVEDIIAGDAAADEAMAKAGEWLRERDRKLVELARLKIIGGDALNRARRRFSVTDILMTHGFGDFADIHVSVRTKTTLADMDRQLLTIRRPPKTLAA